MTQRIRSQLPAPLIDWIEATGNGTVTHLERSFAGVSREAWAVDITTAQGDVKAWFMLWDRGIGPVSNTVFELTREAAVLRALANTAVPVPRIHGVSSELQAFLMERIDGQTHFPALTDPVERQTTAADFMAHLAQLHKIDCQQLTLPDSFPMPANGPEHATLQIALWWDIYRQKVKTPDPLTTFGLQWAERHAPQQVERTVLVHGDTGPGNFIYRDGKTQAIIDWELAHLGDPMEDLAYCAIRDMATPFGDLQQRFAEYRTAGGCAIDIPRIKYYRAFAILRSTIALLAALETMEPTSNVAIALGYRSLLSRALCVALADAMNITLPNVNIPAAGPATERSPYYSLIGQVVSEQLIPQVADPLVAFRGQGSVQLLAYLERAETLGPVIDRTECSELATLTGQQAETPAAALQQLDTMIRRNDNDEAATLLYLWRRAERQFTLTRPVIDDSWGTELQPVD